MKWEEQQCVFSGHIDTAPGLSWIWSEYIIGLENGKYLLSCVDADEHLFQDCEDLGETECLSWSKEVSAEHVVNTFLNGSELCGGWRMQYEGEENKYSLESLIDVFLASVFD